MRSNLANRSDHGSAPVPYRMTATAVLEEILGPEPALPSQFGDIWHRSRNITAERQLALAVLWQAVLDLRKFRYARRRRQQRFYMEAYGWVASDARDWPYACANLCDSLGISVEALRARLLDDDRAPGRGLDDDEPVFGAAA